MWGGCGPSAPGPPWGLHAVESLAFSLPGLWPRNNMYVFMDPSVDCPGGPGLGAQPRRFQNGIRSTAAAGRKRRGGKGRRPSLLGCFALGACLFLSLLRVRQAVSGCRRGGGMSVAAGPREGTSGTATSQCPAWRPLPASPGLLQLLWWPRRCGSGPESRGKWGSTGLLVCSVTQGFL